MHDESLEAKLRRIERIRVERTSSLRHLEQLAADMARTAAELRAADAANRPSATSCVQCDRPWLDPTERWRAMLAVRDQQGEATLETMLVCPECGERELDAD